MATTEELGRTSWDSRLWGMMSRRGFSGTLAVGLVIVSILLGTFTYMTLTGLTPFPPSRWLVLTLLLVPPLLWLGIVYLGSLFALLAQSFFYIDDFSGLTVYEPTLRTYAELFTPANLTIILRTVVMAAAVTVVCGTIALENEGELQASDATALPPFS